jgi:hypothetical protein
VLCADDVARAYIVNEGALPWLVRVLYSVRPPPRLNPPCVRRPLRLPKAEARLVPARVA